jgi:molecular chaperone DnaJ
MPSLKGYGRGDQHVRVIVRTPTNLSNREKELFRELAKLENKKSIFARVTSAFT